jgi:hypothetical protein
MNPCAGPWITHNLQIFHLAPKKICLNNRGHLFRHNEQRPMNPSAICPHGST